MKINRLMRSAAWGILCVAIAIVSVGISKMAWNGIIDSRIAHAAPKKDASALAEDILAELSEIKGTVAEVQGQDRIPWKYVLVTEGPTLQEIMVQTMRFPELVGTSFELPLEIRQRLGVDRVRVAIPGVDVVPGTADVFERAYQVEIHDGPERFAGTVFCVEHPGLDF